MPALGNKQLGRLAACLCAIQEEACSNEALEQHAVRCPVAGARTFMYAGLISCLQKVLQEGGVPGSSKVILKAREMRRREDHSRHGDIVVLDYVARASTYC